jgi:hypothetical protein
MEENIKINYYWDTSDYPELSAKIINKLKQHAEERIFEMRIEGYTQWWYNLNIFPIFHE